MTIEKWLQAQKQAGRVSLPLYIDENGNQCIQTHAYATRYRNSNVEKELNKLRTLDMNDNGVIELPEGTNPKELVKSGLYFTKSWADDSIPMSSSYCVIRVVACDDNIVFLTAYYPILHAVYTNSSYLNDNLKKWLGWKSSTKAKRYGIRINKNDSNPETRCEYILDAVGMKPARMNYLTDTFDYGSWADVWFVKENYPCMLRYDGTEAYKLDPNDYTKKLGGSASDIANKSFGGNAMSAIPLVWVSQYEIGNYEYMIVCDVKYDDSYHAYLHTRSDGSIADVFYERMFEGHFDGTRLRSISGVMPTASQSGTQEITRAKANGALWYTGTFASWNLFEVLLKIMSKTEDSQTAFGRGNCANENFLTTGQLNTKGAFYGSSTNTQAVKVFHCENWWGNFWERRAGLMALQGVVVVKAVPPYNTTGSGYEQVGITYTDSASGYASKTLMTDKGRFALEHKGSESTYTCDYHWHNNTVDGYAISGGSHSYGSYCGCGCTPLDCAVSLVNSSFVASLSCEKPAM